MLSRGAIALAIITAASAGTGAAEAHDPIPFKVSIESVTGPATLQLPDAAAIAAPISPGIYVVSARTGVLFEPGRPAGAGLERLAESGDPEPLVPELNGDPSEDLASAFLHNLDFTITAAPGDRLHFAVMFVQSNDLFYAPASEGIALFSADGRPVSGDLTGELVLWDAGTEKNEQPGTGPHQAPRQATPDSGLAENGTVARVNDGFVYPPTGDVIRVTITPGSSDTALN